MKSVQEQIIGLSRTKALKLYNKFKIGYNCNSYQEYKQIVFETIPKKDPFTNIIPTKKPEKYVSIRPKGQPLWKQLIEVAETEEDNQKLRSKFLQHCKDVNSKKLSIKEKKERLPRKLKKDFKNSKYNITKENQIKFRIANPSFSFEIVENGKILFKSGQGIKYFDNKEFKKILDLQLSKISTNNNLYLTKIYDWGSSSTLIKRKRRIYKFKNKRVYTGWDNTEVTPKLVCLKENSTGKVLKLRKGTFNEGLYTYISKQEYKSVLPRKPFKSKEKCLKIDFAKTGLSADWETIYPEETTITFRDKGEEYEAEVFKVNQSTVRERRRKIKSKNNIIRIYEDISREINYDKYRDPNFTPYKCPPVRNEGRRIDKLTRKAVKEKKRLHQLVLKSHIKNRKRKR